MKALVDAGAVLSGSSAVMKRGFKQDGTWSHGSCYVATNSMRLDVAWPTHVMHGEDKGISFCQKIETIMKLFITEMCVFAVFVCCVRVFFRCIFTAWHVWSNTMAVCVCMWNIASEAQQQNDDLRFDKLMSFNAKNGSSFTAHDVVLPSRAFTVASVAVAEKGETTTSPGCPPASLGDKHNT